MVEKKSITKNLQMEIDNVERQKTTGESLLNGNRTDMARIIFDEAKSATDLSEAELSDFWDQVEIFIGWPF